MSGHIPWSITLALILGQTCMRELTEKTDRGGTFYRLLSFPPTSYREYLFLFSFFFLLRRLDSTKEISRARKFSFSSQSIDH